MNKKDKQILGDHKRVKSKFIPPAIHLLGGFVEISWTQYGIPELVWIRLLNEKHGIKTGAEIALRFTEMCLKQFPEGETKPLLGSLSSFKKLSPDKQAYIAHELRGSPWHKPLIEACGGLIAHYPNCPLAFVAVETDLKPYRTAIELQRISDSIVPLFDKMDSETVFAQATCYYLGVLQGKIHVAAHLPAAKFPEIEKYPNTELSRQVASSVRMMILSLVGGMPDNNPDRQWADYFWNRGLEITPCGINDG